MKLNAKHLTNQKMFPQFVPLRFPDRYVDCPNASPSPANSVCSPTVGLDDSDRRPLARAELASMARLRDVEREDWFVDAELLAAFPNANP